MRGADKVEAMSLSELPPNLDAFVLQMHLSEGERGWLLNIKTAVENEYMEEWKRVFLETYRWYEENYLVEGGRLPNKNAIALEALITTAEISNLRGVHFKGTAHFQSAVSSEIARTSNIPD